MKGQKTFGGFYTESDHQQQIKYIDDYIKTFLNTTIILYRLDVTTSGSVNIYGELETNKKSFLPKVELSCMYNLVKDDDTDTGSGDQKESLIITFTVLRKTLKDLDVTINRGDIISIYDGSENLSRYFEITVNNNIDVATVAAKNYRPYFKTFKGVLVNEDALHIDNLNNIL